MAALGSSNPFEVVAPDGRILGEAADLVSARRAAAVLLVEDGAPRVYVRHIPTGERIGHFEHGRGRLVWRSSFPRRFNPEGEQWRR